MINTQKIGTLLLLFLLGTSVFGQTWFELGIKGGPATTMLLSQNIFDDVRYDHVLTPTYFGAGKIGINFGEYNGIAFQGGISKLRQQFNNNYELKTFDERLVEADITEFAVFFHRTKESGYFEIGPRINLVKSPTSSDYGAVNANYNLSNDIYTSYYGADIGFGAYVIGNDHLTLMTGFRFSYGITPISDDERPFIPFNAIYQNEKNVHVLTAMLAIELNYSLGYLVRSTCGNRVTWISF